MAALRIDWRPPDKVYRTFGVTLVGAAAVLAAVLTWRGTLAPLAAFPLAALALAGAFCRLAPARLARPVYLVFLGPTWVVGQVASRVLLAAFFYGVMTPLGLALRLRRHDPLQLGARRASYWVEANARAASEDFERQF